MRNTIASLAEIAWVRDSHTMLRTEGINSLGDIPLIVIQHGKMQAQKIPVIEEVMEETNQRLQAATAKLSKNGSLIIAENSGHDVVADEPDLVIEAIRSILRMVRGGPAAPSLMRKETTTGQSFPTALEKLTTKPTERT